MRRLFSRLHDKVEEKRRVAEINTDAQVEMQNQEGFELRYLEVVVTLNLCF